MQDSKLNTFIEITKYDMKIINFKWYRPGARQLRNSTRQRLKVKL